MADVFISYARTARDVVLPLAAEIERAGFSVWWDSGLTPGANFRDEIDRQLDACKAVIVVWSSEAIRSDWVIAEADHAWRQKKLISTHVPGLSPHQFPKPFSQSHSVQIADRKGILRAIALQLEKTQVCADPPLSTSALKAARERGDGLKLLPRRLGISRLLSAGLVAFALAFFALALWAGVWSNGPSLAPSPSWAFTGDLFIGEPIPFAWKYARGARAETTSAEQSVLFELASSESGGFGADARTETYADGDHKYIARINGARYWRIRAVENRERRPLSEWSPLVRVAQFDSTLDRMKATGIALIGVSNAEIQGPFKWVDQSGFRGFDIELTRRIVAELSAQLGRVLEARLIPIPWTNLLTAPSEGRADFVISSIAILERREREFRISFSEPYYCTTHVLLYRAGAPDRPFREMVFGKTIGVQEKTTNETVAAHMAKDGLFHIQKFATTEELVNALLKSSIDYGLSDVPFAISARHLTRVNGRDRLSFKTLDRAGLPSSIPQEELVQRYGIAIRAGEPELLSVINGVLASAKQNGELTRLLREAVTNFEAPGGGPADEGRAPSTQERPWECGT